VTSRPDDRPEEPDHRPQPRDDEPGTAGGGSTAATGDEQPDTAPEQPDSAPERGTAGAPVGMREPTPITQQLGRVVIVLLAVLFGVFAVDNSQAVDFSWVFGESRVAPDGTGGVPLIVLLVVAAAVGAALGALIEWQWLRGRRARRAERERD
jgi:uncharacterized integral membrane protein